MDSHGRDEASNAAVFDAHAEASSSSAAAFPQPHGPADLHPEVSQSLDALPEESEAASNAQEAPHPDVKLDPVPAKAVKRASLTEMPSTDPSKPKPSSSKPLSPPSSAAKSKPSNSAISSNGSRRQLGPWTLGKTLGAGSMGKVKLAVNNNTGEKVKSVLFILGPSYWPFLRAPTSG